MPNNLGVGVSRTLDFQTHSWELVIWRANKPPLDSELNLTQQIQDQKFSQLLKETPVGCLDNVHLTSDVLNLRPGTLSCNKLYGANTFILSPFRVNVNGIIVDVRFANVNNGGAAADGASNLVALNPPPATGSRQDLVFLEVWRQLVAARPSSVGKPAPNLMFPFGNTQFAGLFLNEDLQDPNQTVSTTHRVQVQYRIRVQNDIDFQRFPNGVDSSGVLPIGGTSGSVGASGVSGFGFTLLSNNIGLYVAGDGSTSAQVALGSTDGFVYAFPIARIHRRNAQPFTNVNLNGAGQSILSGNKSDRPDGLFSDEVNIWDVEDLRHRISAKGFDLQQVMLDSKERFFKGQHQGLQPTQQTVTSQGTRVLQGDGVTTVDQPGIRTLGKPNAQRRIYSDGQRFQRTRDARTTGQKTTGVSGGNWQSGDMIQIQVGSFSPLATVISASPVPLVETLISGVRTPVAGSFSGLGTTTATYTLGVNPGLTQQNLIITYSLFYPRGNGLSFVAEQFLQVFDPVNATEVFFANLEDPNRERLGLLTRVTNGFSDRIFDRNILNPADALAASAASVQYHFDGGGTNFYTVPAQIAGFSTTNVRRVFSLATGTPVLLDFNETLNPDGTITLTLGVITPVGQTIRAEVGLVGQAMTLSRPTKSIEEHVEVVQVTTSLSGANSYTFEAGGIVLAAQGAAQASFGETGRIFINGVAQRVNWSFTADSPFATITFLAPTSGTLVAYVVRTRTLQSSDQVRVFYRRRPYFGGFLSDQNASTGFKSFSGGDPLAGRLVVRPVYADPTVYHTTAGTQNFRVDPTGKPSIRSAFIETIPFRSVAGIKLSDFDSTPVGFANSWRLSDFTSQIIRETNEPGITGTATAGFFAGNIQFTSVGAMDAQNHLSGQFRLVSPVNHINFSIQLVQVIVADRTHKFIPGELVLLVVSQTDTTVSPDVDWKENELSCLWDIFPTQGRRLLPLP